MEVNLGSTPFDLDFHPSSPLAAVSLVNGDLHLYRYAACAQPERVFVLNAHGTESVRAGRFVDSGRVILTASLDCSIVATDVETGKPTARLKNAHKNPINRLVNLTETLIASGDDNGRIKVWDTRKNICCNSFKAHTDYISDMTYIPDTMQIMATSGDGSLSLSSLKKNKVQSRSEFSEDELLSMVIMKNGKKVVCGTDTGPLLLYSWGHFKDCSDRFVGHTCSVDTLLKLDEHTLISGSEDGVIRLVGILPNRIIAPLAEHSDLPIDRLAFSHDRQFLGSIGYDQMLKIWDLQELLASPPLNDEANLSQQMEAESDDNDDDDGDDDNEMDIDINPQKASGSKKRKADKGQSSSKTSDFFADL